MSVEGPPKRGRTHGLDVGVAVPAQSDGLGSFSLFQATEIQLKIFVVKVDGCDSCALELGGSMFRRTKQRTGILGIEFLVGVKHLNRYREERALGFRENTHLKRAGFGELLA
jgi:hypothetical protein